ncbi:MAG: hypothetical protein CL388_03475 [Acidiferrobacteraceae bacterium]|jgi:hypothetical protein|nr:hypothetical protein [Acidiferrobacteraceae bacterium]MDP6725057.1 hypothetical protein [Arenicellales bacterium]|tara:strand:+ start:1530 stop:1718 length:189 start_codon:yes stop_codon:yes gene_type:complete
MPITKVIYELAVIEDVPVIERIPGQVGVWSPSPPFRAPPPDKKERPKGCQIRLSHHLVLGIT